jgi:hypothetical protein
MAFMVLQFCMFLFYRRAVTYGVLIGHMEYFLSFTCRLERGDSGSLFSTVYLLIFLLVGYVRGCRYGFVVLVLDPDFHIYAN